MDLINIRRKFRELSGRYDLVNEDGSDHGANFFINQASRSLDRSLETTKSWATYLEIKTVGAWYITFPEARAIKEVWLATDEGRWQIEKMRLQDLLASYFAKIPAEITNGTPYYYAPTITRYIPEDITPETLATFAAYIGVIPTMTHDYNAIMLACPVDRSTTVEIKGLFYSATMVEDTDTNFWAAAHPLVLIAAAMRMTHIISGNKPMADILDRGLKVELDELDRDLVEQMIAESDEMEG